LDLLVLKVLGVVEILSDLLLLFVVYLHFSENELEVLETGLALSEFTLYGSQFLLQLAIFVNSVLEITLDLACNLLDIHVLLQSVLHTLRILRINLNRLRVCQVDA
jgi:hypothetical protein